VPRHEAGENVQPKYPEEARGLIVRDALAMLGLTQAQAIRRLNNRPSDAVVSLWCCGKRALAQWAAQCLAQDLRSHAARLTAHARELESVATIGRAGNGGALAAWRAHRAAQKEKAGT
jgi:hypothetical protein